MFKYQSGEVIELNDVVNYIGFGIGVVEEIFEPYSLSAKGMRLPHGGVMVQFPDERRVLLDTTEGEEDFLHEPFSNGYVVTSSGYNDCVMHKAEKLVGKPPHYLLVGPILFYQQNNCQDWAQRLRDKYYELLGDPKVVCECGLHILIVR